MPDEPSAGELYSLGKRNPCNNWAMKDFFSGSREKVHCMLPDDHEYEHSLPHIDFDHSKAWRAGVITDVWYKDKVSDLQLKDPDDNTKVNPKAKS